MWHNKLRTFSFLQIFGRVLTCSVQWSIEEYSTTIVFLSGDRSHGTGFKCVYTVYVQFDHWCRYDPGWVKLWAVSLEGATVFWWQHRQRTVMMLRSSAKQRQWVKKGWWLFFPCQSFKFEDKSLDFAERGCVFSYELSLLHRRHVMKWNRIRKEVDRCMMYVKAMTWLLRCLVIRASPTYTVAKKEPKDVREPGRKKQPSI